jgi:CDP-glycerol glycerophosphotransferase (TagB/SpsB family)
MSFFKDVSLRTAGSDLVGFLRTSGNHSPWLFLAACVPTAIIMYTFYLDTLEKAKPPPRGIIYFESWPATRTIEESKAFIAERQKRKDEMIAREKEAYKAFGRAVGMDVERIEREVNIDRTAKQAATPGAAK